MTCTQESGSASDMRGGGDGRAEHTALEHAIVEDPDSTLARRRVFQHQIRLTVTQEISDTGDVPAGGNCAQVDDLVHERSVAHQPYHALTSGGILPNQVGLAVTLKSPAPTICQPPATVGRLIPY